MITSIQNEIESTYRISCPFSVEEFLLDESHRKSYLTRFPWLAHSQEVLLVEQEGHDLHVGLFLDSKLLDWSRNKKWNGGDGADLDKMGPLIEGVSHFVYLTWRAEQDRPVTQLELELQGEVDKFVLFSREHSPEKSAQLFERLFHKVSWLQGLKPDEKFRYETAIQLASRYCHFLKSRFFLPSRPEALFPEIRSFYRMSQSEKIRHIQH